MRVLARANKNSKIHRIKRKSVIGQLVLALLGLEILFFASFTAIKVPAATGRNLKCFLMAKAQRIVNQLPERVQKKVVRFCPAIEEPVAQIRSTYYVPQVPATIFIGYILGFPLSGLAACLFLALGLLGPIGNIYPFAAGGGLDYYVQPGFGYLLALPLAATLVSLITRNRRTSLSQILALITGLSIVHILGIAYLLGVCFWFSIFEDSRTYPTWLGWLLEEVRNMSWYTLPYDFLLTLLLIGIGFPMRWFFNTLIAPDIALRAKTLEGDLQVRGSES